MIDGDLTTYKATIKERNLWIVALIRMANHGPVVLVAGNPGAELSGDSVGTPEEGVQPALARRPDWFRLFFGHDSLQDPRSHACPA